MSIWVDIARTKSLVFGTVKRSFFFLTTLKPICALFWRGSLIFNWLLPLKNKTCKLALTKFNFVLSAQLARKCVTSSLLHKDASFEQIQILFNYTASQKRCDIIILVYNIRTMVEWCNLWICHHRSRSSKACSFDKVRAQHGVYRNCKLLKTSTSDGILEEYTYQPWFIYYMQPNDGILLYWAQVVYPVLTPVYTTMVVYPVKSSVDLHVGCRHANPYNMGSIHLRRFSEDFCGCWYAFVCQVTSELHSLGYICYHRIYKAQLWNTKPLTKKRASRVETTCSLELKSSISSSWYCKI